MGLNYYFEFDSVREEVLERDDYRCRLCKSHEEELDRSLDVHHIYKYNKFFEDIDDVILEMVNEGHLSYLTDDITQKLKRRAEVAHNKSNLITVCRKCHTGEDGIEYIPVDKQIQLLQQIPDVHPSDVKSIKNKADNKVDNMGRPINKWLLSNVKEVVVFRPIGVIDINSNVEYIFKFREYDESIKFNSIGEIFREPFYKEIKEATGQELTDPIFDECIDNWEDFISNFISLFKTEKHKEGKYTRCIYNIKSSINKVYTDWDKAMDERKIYYDDKQEELYIPSVVFSKALKNTNGLTIDDYMSVQSEIENKYYNLTKNKQSNTKSDERMYTKIEYNGELRHYFVVPEEFCSFNIINN